MPFSTEDINHKYLFNVGPSLLVELFSFVEKGWANVPCHPPPLFTLVALRRMFLFCLLLIKLVINYILSSFRVTVQCALYSGLGFSFVGRELGFIWEGAQWFQMGMFP